MTGDVTEENVSDPFQEVWEIFHEGCQCRGHMINWDIVKYNMNHPDGQNFIERHKKTNRKNPVTYNEKKLQLKVWAKSAALLKESSR